MFSKKMNSIKVIKGIALSIQRRFLGFDKRVIKSSYNMEELTPVFIVGAPRSGSTLLYQVILKYFGFSYFSNLSTLLPSITSLTTSIQKMFGKELWTKIQPSYYGYVSGFFAPNEAGKYCDFLFNNSDFEHIENVRKTFYYYQKKTRSPLLVKNLNNSLRLQRIHQIFPNAKIIFVHRDECFNTQSIINGRIKTNNDIKQWFSVRPENWQSVCMKDPFYQVVWQVKTINQIIYENSELFGSNFFSIQYEELEKMSEEIFEELKAFLKRDINEDDSFGFVIKNKVTLNNEEWNLVRKYSRELEL